MADGAINGSDVMLYVNRGTTGSPQWTAIGAQRGLSHDQSRNLINTSAKGDDDETYLYGRRSGTLSLESLYVPADDGYAFLQAALDNKDVVVLRRYEGENAIEEAEALVSSLNRSWPDEDVGTASISLQLSGGWSPVSP